MRAVGGTPSVRTIVGDQSSSMVMEDCVRGDPPMIQHHSILFAACLGLLSAACSDNDTNLDTNDEDPHGGGTIELDLGTGTDSFWADTDGVDPEVAGCHVEFSDSDCD